MTLPKQLDDAINSLTYKSQEMATCSMVDLSSVKKEYERVREALVNAIKAYAMDRIEDTLNTSLRLHVFHVQDKLAELCLELREGVK